MTETLAEKTCTPCRGGVPPLARDEVLRFQSQAPEWVLRDDARRIERTVRFRNFREALAFVQRVGPRHRLRRNRLSRPPRRSTSPRARLFRSDRVKASGSQSRLFGSGDPQLRVVEPIFTMS